MLRLLSDVLSPRAIGGVLIAASLSLAAPALAVQPDEVLDDPALEARARAISQELRCLVCQNESIDASNAPLARDLRVIVRERLEAGASDAEVRAFVVSKYGDFVLLKPLVKPSTYALWYGPFAILIVGIAVVAVYVVRQRRAPVACPAELDSDERRRLDELMGSDETR